MDVSGNPLKRPATPIPQLLEGIKTLDDLFGRMRENSTLETYRDMAFVATGVEPETKPLTEADMEEPTPMSKEMDAMPVQPRFNGLFKFKSAPPPSRQTSYSNPHTTLSAPEERSQ
jgi:hypothetical protein